MPLQNRVTPLGELIAHPARGLVYGNRARLHASAAGALPDGVFVLHDGTARVVVGDELVEWAPGGYGGRVPRPHRARMVATITPPSLVALLRTGWEPLVPLLHPSAAR